MSERVVLDSTVLLGDLRRQVVALAELGCCRVYWSNWIISEVVRNRTEWIAERAVKDRCDLAETRRRFEASRQRVNALISELSHTLTWVDYQTAPDADLSWLSDADDWPIMQTALAAGADVLVTDNSKDFPLGQERNGVLLLSTKDFIARIYDAFPKVEASVHNYLKRATGSI